jgi:hypothetical protein
VSRRCRCAGLPSRRQRVTCMTLSPTCVLCRRAVGRQPHGRVRGFGLLPSSTPQSHLLHPHYTAGATPSATHCVLSVLHLCAVVMPRLVARCAGGVDAGIAASVLHPCASLLSRRVACSHLPRARACCLCIRLCVLIQPEDVHAGGVVQAPRRVNAPQSASPACHRGHCQRARHRRQVP